MAWKQALLLMVVMSASASITPATTATASALAAGLADLLLHLSSKGSASSNLCVTVFVAAREEDWQLHNQQDYYSEWTRVSALWWY